MTTTRKVAIGLGIAGGALLAAWLLTGERKKKTKEFVFQRASDLKKTLKKKETSPEDPEIHYV